MNFSVEVPSILVTGGSGYLGQFLVQALADAAYKVAFTYHSTVPPKFAGDVQGFWVDLASGEGLQKCMSSLSCLVAVINTAAISSPAACEKNPQLARALNVPSKLVEELRRHAAEHRKEPILIHLSTDQVYNGSRSFWQEEEAGQPVNVYGSSKLEAEELIQEQWQRHIILRSSIIYGPQCPVPVSRALFLQFVAQQLAEDKPTSFFYDEFRNPVYVNDIVSIVLKLLEKDSQSPLTARVYNMGGPERLSRLDIAEKVAETWGYSRDAIISASSSSMDRGFCSPADVSMDSSRLAKELHLKSTAFQEALAKMGRPLQRVSSARNSREGP